LRSNNAIFVVDCWSSGITLSNGFNQTITCNRRWNQLH
jgi:hypothetical protein